MECFNDVYREYTNQFSVKLVKDLAQYLCDRFPQNYSHLVVELCKMFCNQRFDTRFVIDEEIRKLPFILSIEGGI